MRRLAQFYMMDWRSSRQSLVKSGCTTGRVSLVSVSFWAYHCATAPFLATLSRSEWVETMCLIPESSTNFLLLRLVHYSRYYFRGVRRPEKPVPRWVRSAPVGQL